MDDKNQDGKAHDGQSAAGPSTEEHRRPSQDDVHVISSQHGAVDAAVEEDAAADEDGKMYLHDVARKLL